MTALLLMLSAVVLAPLCGCQRGAADPEMQRLSLNLPQTDGPLVLHVRSDAFDTNGEIPAEHTAYGRNASPLLNWSGVPEGAKSIAVMVEDPDAPEPKPFVHWLVYNLSPYASGLPADVPPGDYLSAPAGAAQGKNSANTVGYSGPRPPVGDPAHHYHFQVFALDKELGLKAGATRQDLIRAMNGHVVAKGQLVGTYRER
jgi:Raf kinase inhibitor-like YbhB/YbcL family protein